jgi:hypothetical protein
MKKYLYALFFVATLAFPAGAWIHGALTTPPNTIALSNTAIVEMSANGTFLGNATIVGSSTGTPAWSLVDALGVFQINSSTGAVTVLSNTNLVHATHPTIPISISVAGVTPPATTGNFTVNVTTVGAPGLVAGTYGSTTASGWTTVGPSDGTLASLNVTNIIYVSDSMGSDNRDGSTPTFVDDNDTAQFVVSPSAAVVLNSVYQAANGTQFTVALSNSFAISGEAVLMVQMKNRTGTPAASGTLTLISGTGDATLTYSAFTFGIHGPVKTLIKAIGGSGPGVILDPDNTNLPGLLNGDGSGLGTKGNWRTAGSIGSSFALRNGAPDWVLLRMGDTWTNQTFEKGYNSMASDNFAKNGFSEQEPLVISAYDEDVPATSPNLPSGARPRPIIIVPGATDAYAAMQGAGNYHAFQARPGINLTAGNGNYVAIMGLDFYAAQRNPSDGAYVGMGNVSDGATAIDHRGNQTGSLIEDVRASWFFTGFNFSNATGSINIPSNFDVNIRRSQVNHCYHVGSGHALGMVADSVGAIGGAMSPGFSFDENVMDFCGYPDSSFTFGDDFSRNAYLQGDTVFGSRQGNTSTRSASEGVQFRSGGIINDNFLWANSYGYDVGHSEGFPALTSATMVTNNVIMATGFPYLLKAPIGMNFANANNLNVTGNITADLDSSTPFAASGIYAATDRLDGQVTLVTTTTAGSGGTPGNYAIGAGAGCFGGANFTGGHGTNLSSFAINIGGGGAINGDPTFVEPNGSAWLVGDVLTPIANYPSLRSEGMSFAAVGSGGTPGDYGIAFGHCPRKASVPVSGDTQTGVPLTNFSGSMAGSGALATFTFNSFTSTTRTLIGPTYHATGVTTATNTIGLSVFNGGGPGVGTETITTTGFTPSAYNGIWTIDRVNGTSLTQLVWDLGTAVDPGPVTVQGKVAAVAIVSTGAGYQAGDVLTVSSSDVGGQTGVHLTVGTVAHLSGWTITVARVESSGVHGLQYTGNIVFNFPNAIDDEGGSNDGGTPNVWTPNTFCGSSQFTGTISGTTLSTSAVVNGPITTGNLSGPGVTAGSTIVGGGPTSWTITPSQTVSSPVTMYSYVCTPTTVYTAPYRTVETYATSLSAGLAASIDGYMYGNSTTPVNGTTGAMNNAKWNWNPAYTANNGINPYIRSGFQ